MHDAGLQSVSPMVSMVMLDHTPSIIMEEATDALIKCIAIHYMMPGLLSRMPALQVLR
jgi:hypothetical protein